ncbi:MAG: SDR family NAD(P)-dependent oxidoreductase [Pseudomonadota bacterium]
MVELSRSVAGHVVVITGAASGMGRATAEVFAAEGARVALLDLDAAGVEQVAESIRSTDADADARAWALDVADRAAVARVIAEIGETYDRIDVLVNNAGISRFVAIDSDDYEGIWDRTVAVLLTAHTATIRAALPYLRNASAPRIINIASTEGLGATKFGSPYSAAKTGVIGLTRSLAVELGVQGITVNCVCPGPIRTGMTAEIPEDQKATYARRRVALKRYAEPEEVAHATLSLALPAASFITGVALPVDGGLTIKNA